jgi:hypothetical protein
VLQVLEKNQASALLYNAVIWQLLEDKWREFASLIFYWFVFCNLLSLAALTLALCTSSESREALSGMRAFSPRLCRGRSAIAAAWRMALRGGATFAPRAQRAASEPHV